MSPAGMEPAGAGDIDEAPKGRAFGKNASQSNLRFALSLRWPTLWYAVSCPRREWSPRERSDIDEAPKGRAFGKNASQSNPSLCAILTLVNPLVCRVVSPAGMEPAGAARHRKSPAG